MTIPTMKGVRFLPPCYDSLFRISALWALHHFSVLPLLNWIDDSRKQEATVMSTLQLQIDFAVFSDFDCFDVNKFLADFTFNFEVHRLLAILSVSVSVSAKT